MKPARVLILLGISILVFSGCTGGSSEEALTVDRSSVDEFAASAPMTESESPMDTTISFDERSQQQQPEQPQERIILKNATLSLIVEDVPGKVAEITALVESMEGWVITSNINSYTDSQDREVAQGSITVRVPADRLNEAMERAKRDVEKVLAENITGQDVTQQYIDQESRLKNLEAAEEQLQAIMEDARSTEDVLAVYNQLVSTRSEIEVIRGQLEYWSQAAAFSSLRVDLAPPESEPALIETRWQPGETAEEAYTALIDGLQGVVDLTIWGMVFCLPFVLILGLPLVLVGWFARRRGWVKLGRGIS